MIHRLGIILASSVLAHVALAADVAATSRIAGVTVYQSGALVAREVTVPEGSSELVVASLPASTVQNSLYAEGNDTVRVLTTRYRSRPLAQAAQEDMRKLEAQLKDLAKSENLLRRQSEANTQNLQLLSKMENFTEGSLKQLTDKGMLNSDAVQKLAQFIMTARETGAQQTVTLEQQMQAGKEQAEFARRELAKLANSSDKTSREAVIVVDRGNAAGAGKVMLYYMVSAASWKPQYKVRAATAGKQVEIEYLAAVNQQTGEDWPTVDVVLSTAMPMFNAAPPELAVMEVQPGALQAQNAADINIDGRINLNRMSSNLRQQRLFEQSAQAAQVKGSKSDADRDFNLAASVAQADELLQEQAELKKAQKVAEFAREGQSVTFHLDRRLSIPWRDDEQLVEVTRLKLEADYLYKAVPVLTPHVYRLANLTNSSKTVLLPGEAIMYVGTDFVGRATLPLVAIGQSFTAGFGVDPQIQVSRLLVDKAKSIQGGNQVQKFDYRVTINNYKAEEVKLQLWDRIPYAEGEAITVTLGSTAPALSTNEEYARDQQKKGLMRWDLTLAPNTQAAKATNVTYQYKLEYAKDATIGNIFNR